MQGAVIVTYKWAKATANSRKGNIVTKILSLFKVKVSSTYKKIWARVAKNRVKTKTHNAVHGVNLLKA